MIIGFKCHKKSIKLLLAEENSFMKRFSSACSHFIRGLRMMVLGQLSNFGRDIFLLLKVKSKTKVKHFLVSVPQSTLQDLISAAKSECLLFFLE